MFFLDDDVVVVVMMRLGLFYLGLGKFKSMAGQAQLVIYQSSKGEFAKNTRKSKERCAHISVKFCFFVSANLLRCLHNFQIENLVDLFRLGVIFILVLGFIPS